MKEGDLVRYKLLEYKFEPGESRAVFGAGLLIEFNKVQRTCIILDDKTGKIVLKHCSDVQLVKVGHASR